MGPIAVHPDSASYGPVEPLRLVPTLEIDLFDQWNDQSPQVVRASVVCLVDDLLAA